MKSWIKSAALVGAAAVVLVAVARAQDAPVRIELRSGERVEGELVEFGDHVYRVRSAGGVREVKESDVARLDFLPGSVAGASSACPACGAPGMGLRCAADGTPLVRSDLVVLHETLDVLARGETQRGLENPFRKLVRPDGSVDVAGLERLVADYKLAAKAHAFGDWKGAVPLADTSRRFDYANVVDELKKITVAQSVFREGDKEQDGNLDYGMLSELSNTSLVDSVLGSGTKHGYLFNASYSHTTSEILWFATAVPEKPRAGDLSFYTNASGVISAGERIPPFNHDICPPTIPGMEPIKAGDLARPVVFGQARPVRTAEDVLPSPEEILAGLEVEKVEKLGPEALETERVRLRTRLEQNPTDPAEVQALRDRLEGLEGVAESIVASYREGSGRLLFSVTRFESLEARRRGVPVQIRTEDRQRASGSGAQTPETFRSAGVLVVSVANHLASPFAFASLETFAARRLEQAAPGDVRTERVWLKSDLEGRDLAAPFARLPAGLISVEPLEASAAGPLAGFARATSPEARVLYRSLEGTVTLSLFGGARPEPGKPRGVLGGPTPEQLARYRNVWLAETCAVALSVEGKVSADALGWLESFVESALKSASETKDARRVETGWSGEKARPLDAGSPVPAGEGWSGEALPRGLRRGAAKPVYIWDTGKGVALELVHVPAGDFLMGTDAPDASSWERPKHPQDMDHDYWIGRTDVTWKQYLGFCDATGHPKPEAPRWGIDDDHPVVNVSWDDLHGSDGFLTWAGVELPDEREWEKAARGEDGRLYPWGNGELTTSLCAFGQEFEGGGGTSPAGGLPAGASPCGALGMAGNVYQWCENAWDAGASLRVVRGSSWCTPAPDCGSFRRKRIRSSSRETTIGFRVVLRSRGAGPLPIGDGKPHAPPSVVASLHTIVVSEGVFHDDDKYGAPNFGSLAALLKAGLVDDKLGSGEKFGYVFDAWPSTTDPRRRWFATATPDAAHPGGLHLFVNHTGKILGSTRAFFVDPGSCEPPLGLEPVADDWPAARSPESPGPEATARSRRSYVTLESGTPPDPTKDGDAAKGSIDVEVWVWHEGTARYLSKTYRGVLEGKTIGQLETGYPIEGKPETVDFRTGATLVEVGQARHPVPGLREPTSTLFAKIRWPGTAPGAEPETVWEKERAPFTPGAK